MRQYTVKYRQSLLDVALQECGDISAVVDIAVLNGISITEDLNEGDILILPEIIKNEVAKYYKDRNIVLATDIPRPNKFQTIAFPAISNNLQPGDIVNLEAVASSGLPVSYVSTNPSVAIITNNVMTILAVGAATIVASQAGDNIWYPASVSQNLVVPKLQQTITWSEIPDLEVGDNWGLDAIASSGLPVIYEIDDPSIASISDNVLSILAAGTFSITATQAGNDTYEAASLSQNVVSSKKNQTISFTLQDEAELSESPITLVATATSGLSVSFSSSNPLIASVSGNTLTLLQAGTVTITATQAGNGQWNAAVPVLQEITINAATLPEPVFDLNPATTSGFIFSSGNIVSGFNNRGKSFYALPTANSYASILPDMTLLLGPQAPITEGVSLNCVSPDPLISSFQWIFIVSDEGALGASSTYNMLWFDTAGGASNLTPINGFRIRKNNTQNIRAVNRSGNVSINTQGRIAFRNTVGGISDSGLLSPSTQTTLSLRTIGATSKPPGSIQVVAFKLQDSITPSIFAIGGPYRNVSLIFSQLGLKRLKLYNGITDDEADTIFNNLINQYL